MNGKLLEDINTELTVIINRMLPYFSRTISGNTEKLELIFWSNFEVFFS